MTESLPRPVSTDQVYLSAIYRKLVDIEKKLGERTAPKMNDTQAVKKTPAKGGKK